jgi:hypothetical protein
MTPRREARGAQWPAPPAQSAIGALSLAPQANRQSARACCPTPDAGVWGARHLGWADRRGDRRASCRCSAGTRWLCGWTPRAATCSGRWRLRNRRRCRQAHQRERIATRGQAIAQTFPWTGAYIVARRRFRVSWWPEWLPASSPSTSVPACPDNCSLWASVSRLVSRFAVAATAVDPIARLRLATCAAERGDWLGRPPDRSRDIFSLAVRSSRHGPHATRPGIGGRLLHKLHNPSVIV